MGTGKKFLKMDIKISTIKNGIRNNYVLNTPFINAVLNIIRATYLEYSNIEIANPMPCNEIDALGSFLTYVLAYPPNVKTPIVKVKENSCKMKKQFKKLKNIGKEEICLILMNRHL